MLFKELIQNNLFKPGTKLSVLRKYNKFLPESKLHLCYCRVPHYSNMFSLLNDSLKLSINIGEDEQAVIPYICFVERVGKTGKQRMEKTLIHVPVFSDTMVSKEKQIFNYDEHEVFNTLELNSSDFSYWFLSRAAFNDYLRHLLVSEIGTTTVLKKLLDINYNTTMPHTQKVKYFEDISSVLSYFDNQGTRKEAIIELREAESIVAKFKIIYAIRMMAMLRRSMEVLKRENIDLEKIEAWSVLETFLNTMLVSNKIYIDQVRKVKDFISLSLPKDKVLKQSMMYTLSQLT